METSSYGSKPKKELRQKTESTSRVEVGDHVLEGDALKRSGQVRQAVKASTEVHRTLRDTQEGEYNCISVGVTTECIRCP